MVTKEPKNEQRLCESVARILSARRGEAIIKAEPRDSVVRNKPAVEWVYDTPSMRFAVEHTRIETFPSQIAEGKRFQRMLEPLEAELAGKLPGVFFLVVDVGAAKAPSADHGEIRRALAEWILTNGDHLDPAERPGRRGRSDITATVPGVPFEVTLHRDCDYESRLFVGQRVTGDRERAQRERIREALERKSPKLLVEHNEGCVSVLILESDDAALANQVDVVKAAIAELAARDDAPDIVIWARTSTSRWKGCFIKDGATVCTDTESPPLLVLER